MRYPSPAFGHSSGLPWYDYCAAGLKAVSGSKKLVRHAEQQGLAPHRLEVEELFGEKVRGDEFLS